jgi:hypothetical protein
LKHICKSYEGNRKNRKRKEEKKIKIEKGLGNPSAQRRKETRSPSTLFPNRYATSLLPSLT